ncbi:hypothetical protein ACIGO8_11865 [Streptomyces sp. NPDC053493]|uniref:TRADD-N-associated membrane domain-containing protein n=1 Tax=Streptomyces sp. NPDC053493 TaxID=3365705 RepID=UPI0037CF801C
MTLSPKHITFARRFCKTFGLASVFIAGSFTDKNDHYQLEPKPVDSLEFWFFILSIFASLFFFGLARFFKDSPPAREESLMRVQAAEEQVEASLSLRPNPDSSPNDSPERGDSSHLALASLWSLTHARLHQYHGIALDQARKSFRNAQGAMLIGFALLVGFTILALKAESTATSVAAAVLGSVSAALAGFVSRTFVRSQESSASHLQRYFDQPLEFSRYLAAERLIVDSGLNAEQRADVLTALVQAMISGPPQEPPTVDPEPPVPRPGPQRN